MLRNSQGRRSAQRERPPERSSSAVRAHTSATTAAVLSDVVAALSMSPGMSAKRVRCHFSTAQRTVSASGIQNATSEHSTLQASKAQAAGRASVLRAAAADAGGIGFWLMIEVAAQAATATSSTVGTISTADTMAATCELWLASQRLCRPTLKVSMPRRSAAA